MNGRLNTGSDIVPGHAGRVAADAAAAHRSAATVIVERMDAHIEIHPVDGAARTAGTTVDAASDAAITESCCCGWSQAAGRRRSVRISS